MENVLCSGRGGGNSIKEEKKLRREEGASKNRDPTAPAKDERDSDCAHFSLGSPVSGRSALQRALYRKSCMGMSCITTTPKGKGEDWSLHLPEGIGQGKSSISPTETKRKKRGEKERGSAWGWGVKGGDVKQFKGRKKIRKEKWEF